MAYCLYGDVATEFKDITFSSTTAVTDSDITAFIDQASALIDGEISNRYAVPVTGTASLLILKMICIWIVKSRVLSILSVKTPQDKTKQDPDGPSILKQAMDMLKSISSGGLDLVDAEAAAGATGGIASYLMGQDVTYKFQRDTDAW